MTSARKIRANRQNAQSSTGPKTPAGRAKSARNALRHALNVPVYRDPLLLSDIEALSQEIAGAETNVETQELARRVAEADLDLRRVRSRD